MPARFVKKAYRLSFLDRKRDFLSQVQASPSFSEEAAQQKKSFVRSEYRKIEDELSAPLTEKEKERKAEKRQSIPTNQPHVNQVMSKEEFKEWREEQMQGGDE